MSQHIVGFGYSFEYLLNNYIYGYGFDTFMDYLKNGMTKKFRNIHYYWYTLRYQIVVSL